ncbi:MAG TPA: MFS transporter [Solirubrobacteraceae bacterium]|jgi:predicted MFS family arabinose efflux permease|nr:MFS transporter [Solirubrobacteraceae bacterium]
MRDATGTSPQHRRHGWTVIGAFALLAAATQLLWLTYAPITTGTAHHYRVSESAVGWLSEIFPLFYVVLAIPAGKLLDRSLHGGLAAGALLTVLGGSLRLVADDFAWALAGQCVVALAQPLVLGAISKLADERLPEPERHEGIAIGSAGMMVGMLLAPVLGSALGAARIHALLVIGAAFSVVAAGALLGALRLPRADSGAAGAALAPAAALGPAVRCPLREVWTDGQVRVLAGLVFVGFGVFIALATWLQALLDHYGVSSNAAGGVLVAMVLLGAVGSAALAPYVIARGAEQRLIAASIVVGVGGSVILAAVHVFALDAVILGAMGLLLLTDLPIILELAERRAGNDGGTVAGLMWLAGNGGGLVVAVLVQALVHHPVPAFLLLAAVGCAAIPLVARLRPGVAAGVAPGAGSGSGSVEVGVGT